MNADPNRATRNQVLARRFIDAINARDLEALDELVTDDVVRHSPSTPDVVVTNREELKAFLREDFRGVPDSVIGVRMMISEGDLVAIWATYSGTQDGPMGPFPPSGRPVELEWAGMMRMSGGRIAELWAVWDNLGTLMQLGHLPPPPPPDG